MPQDKTHKNVKWQRIWIFLEWIMDKGWKLEMEYKYRTTEKQFYSRFSTPSK